MTSGARQQDRGVGVLSARASSWLAWSLCLLCVAPLAVGAALLPLNGSNSDVGTWGTANLVFIFPVVILSFALVGALIASRLPTNPIGWVCLGIGLTLTLAIVTGKYYVYALQTRHGSLPGGVYMAWLTNWLWVPAVVSIGTFLVLLFPDGCLPTRRWRLISSCSRNSELVSYPGIPSVPVVFIPGLSRFGVNTIRMEPGRLR